jgi:hypothetical protein
MPEYNKADDNRERQIRGYTPKGYIIQEVNGQAVKIPVTELKIIPPKGGSAVVPLKK